MKNYFFLLFLLPTLLTAQLPTTVQTEKAGFSKARLERLGNYFQKAAEKDEIPGAVCMIYRKGELAHQATYGYTNSNAKTPIQSNEIFYIQSMTKPIISVALMMLYEEGHFELFDPITQYLPEFKGLQVAVYEGDEMTLQPAEKDITIGHLFTHTAGFLHGLGSSDLEQKYRVALYGDAENQDDVAPHQTIQDRVAAMTELPLVSEPGTEWHYSASPDVLAVLIEQFSGQTVDQFLKERIFEPLGMNDTGYNLTEAQTKRATGLHLQTPNKQVMYLEGRQTPTSGNTIFGGTHGLFSTPTDYAKFAMMLLNKGEFNGKQLLSRKTWELMTANHVGDIYEPGLGFGLGFGVRTDLADAGILGSEGAFYWNGAFNTYFIVDPKEEMVALLFMQFWPYTDDYRRQFLQLLYQGIVD
ncbi:MAG: serine hydrolase domain-containing protein [Bacteroidota bacterium]